MTRYLLVCRRGGRGDDMGRGRHRELTRFITNFPPHTHIPPPGAHSSQVGQSFHPLEGLVYIGSACSFCLLMLVSWKDCDREGPGGTVASTEGRRHWNPSSRIHRSLLHAPPPAERRFPAEFHPSHAPPPAERRFPAEFRPSHAPPPAERRFPAEFHPSYAPPTTTTTVSGAGLGPDSKERRLRTGPGSPGYVPHLIAYPGIFLTMPIPSSRPVVPPSFTPRLCKGPQPCFPSSPPNGRQVPGSGIGGVRSQRPCNPGHQAHLQPHTQGGVHECGLVQSRQRKRGGD